MKERGNKLLKIFDKYAGIPLIFLFGLFKRKRRFDSSILRQDPVRFILLKTAAIGDTIILSAIVNELKSSFPKSEITLICSKANNLVAQFLPGLDHIIIFDVTKPFQSLKAVLQLGAYDILFDFASWAKLNSLISYFIAAKFKVGFKRRGMYRHYIYDLAVEHRDGIHEIDNYRNLLTSVSIQVTGLSPAFLVTEENAKKVESIFQKKGRNIIFHPFPGGTKKHLKEWPPECWIKTGEVLGKQGVILYISGGKEDLEQAEQLKQQLEKVGATCVNLAGKYTLAEMAAILAKTDLLITVNTGIMHLGASVGTPIVALHGPTSPQRWGPVSNQAIIIKPKLKCAPCISLGFEYGCNTGECMMTITVDEVIQAAQTIIRI
jgi:heptosyltransferase I